MGAKKIGWVGKIGVELLHVLLEMEAERELSRWIAIELGVRLCIGFEGEEKRGEGVQFASLLPWLQWSVGSRKCMLEVGARIK